ncbi:hypothetical protein SSX86_033002 [Deinandra increscens subsp. villosa]|uniref:PGG domain-containing protein n=1 Tax=Deinandra increscens subsp. villosa TaxID=3103831 RepID=A0AAP0C5Z4_9ASTR
MGTSVRNKTSALSPKIHKSERVESIFDKLLMGVDKLIVVAALITTATFAAGFTVPGGFDSSNGSNQGTPFLLKKAAFQAFVVTNAIAFSCACLVLFEYVTLLMFPGQYKASLDKQESIDFGIYLMYSGTGVALMAMLIAFVTGVYVVLTPTHGLAVAVCVVSLSCAFYKDIIFEVVVYLPLILFRYKDTLMNFLMRPFELVRGV